MMLRLGLVGRCAGVVLFIVLCHLAVALDRPLFITAACLMLAAPRLFGHDRDSGYGYAVLYMLSGLTAALSVHVADLAALLPALGYLLAMVTFGRTLQRGREPLLATYCRLQYGRVPDECRGYTRGWTLVWTVLLGMLALESVLLQLAGWGAWLGVASGVNIGVMLVVFFGENGLRRVRYPHLPLASPFATGRIILRAHLGR